MDSIEVLKMYADWCQPCRAYERVFSHVTSQLGVTAHYINIDNEAPIAAKFNVTNIPTTIVLKNGVEVNRAQGALRDAQLRGLITEAL